MKQLILNIEHWAEERNIIQGATLQKQLFKLVEEIGELFSGHNKNDYELIKDSLGDCVVVLAILRKMFDSEDTIDEMYENAMIYVTTVGADYEENSLVRALLATTTLTYSSVTKPLTKSFAGEKLGQILRNLAIYAYTKGLDIKDCTEHAYNQIKDRKGKMINGVFVKEADLNAPLA